MALRFLSLSLCMTMAIQLGILRGPANAAAEPSESAFSLDMIVDLALANNPVVSAVEGRLEQQRGQQTAAGAYPNPTVTGFMGYGEIRDTGRADIRDTLNRQSITEYNVTIGQPVEWPSLRSARQRAADAGLARSNAGMSETRLKLTAQVKVAFYDLLLAQQDAALAHENLAIVEGVARIVKARVKSGEAPKFESIKAEVEVLKAKQQLARSENVVRVSRVVLDSLAGGTLGSSYVIRGDFSVMPKELHLEQLLARMVDQHPTIRRLLKSVEQSEWKIEFERQSRLPSVTVNGSYWREIGREAFQGGLSVPMPLWYRRQGEIALSLGVKRAEEAELLRTRNELSTAVHRHFQDARTSTDLIEVFDKGLLKQAQEALRLAQFSFQQGASSLLEVFDAQRV